MNTVKSIVQREKFPSPQSEWQPLFDAEGVEIRGEPMRLNFLRYVGMESDGRLAFIGARASPSHLPIGYAVGYWYTDLHWNERVAADDIWYVVPHWRKQGIGKALKRVLHSTLLGMGVKSVYELTRSEYYHPRLMADLGYKLWGERWIKDLSS